MNTRFSIISSVISALLFLLSSSTETVEYRKNGLTYTYTFYASQDFLSLVTPVVVFIDEAGMEQEKILMPNDFVKELDGKEYIWYYQEPRIIDGELVIDANHHVVVDTVDSTPVLCWQTKLFFADKPQTRMPKHQMSIKYKVKESAKAISDNDDIYLKCYAHFSGEYGGVYKGAIWIDMSTSVSITIGENTKDVLYDSNLINNYADLQDFLRLADQYTKVIVLGPEKNN